MVKPDVKVNYYAALELGSDASVDDCKKQYRKLALKWHPDRNPGKEEEVAPKFQAIAAAHEILSDPATKSKYDADRRRANLGGGTSRPAAPGQRGNPYSNATSGFAPPPRRTPDPTRPGDPQSWAKPAGSRSGASAATGAERFASFPGPSPTARNNETRKQSAAEAWDNLYGAGKRKTPTQPSHPQHPQHQAQQNAAHQRRQGPPVPPRENPPPPPRPPELPKREEEIRAGYNYRPAPSFANSNPAAYAHFNPPPNPNTQRPGMQRSNTGTAQQRTPTSRRGFNPNAPGSDERPNSGPSNYHTHASDTESHPPPPPAFNHTVQQPNGARHNSFARSRPPSIDTRGPYPHQRQNSTYLQSGGEKTYVNSDQLKRSQSVRDNTKLGDPPRSPRTFNHNRHHSASPTKFTRANGAPKKGGGFDLPGSSDDTTSDSASSNSSNADPKRTNTFPQRPRPKKRPTPPSTRLNGTPVNEQNGQTGYQSRRGSQTRPSRANSGSTQAGQPASHLYDQPSPSSHDSTYPKEDNRVDNSPLASTEHATGSRRDSFPAWAIPLSVQINAASKRDIPPTDFQQADWIYVEDPPLVDVTDDAAQGVSCHPCCITHCVVSTKTTHERDMELLAGLHSGFGSVPFNFDKNDQSKSRSAEEINTTFSPTSFTTFTGTPGAKPGTTSPATSRRGSPPKRGRETLSARPSRNHISQRLSADARVPPSPTSAPNPRLFAEIPSGGADSPFAPEQWTNHNFFGGSPPVSRKPSVRRSSVSGGARLSGQAPPASVSDPSEANDERDSGSQHSTLSGDAMDIDPPAPNQQQQQQQQRSARPVSVAPTPWRYSQNLNQPANNSRRRSSARSATDPSAHPHTAPASANPAAESTTMPSLQPLSATLNGNSGAGLNDMTNLASPLPYTPKPSSSHPSKRFSDPASAAAAAAPLPHIPVPPAHPQRWSRSSFKDYTAKFAAYLAAVHNVNKQIAAHAAETLEVEEKLLRGGPAGLQAQGESSGEGSTVGLEVYGRRWREEERWRELGTLLGTEHGKAVVAFGRVKERCRELAEKGTLPD